MDKIINIGSVAEYNAKVSQETFHPLVSVIDFSKKGQREKTDAVAVQFGFYAVFIKEDNKHCEIRYGRNRYDYQEGTLVFIAPGQVVKIERDGKDYAPGGYVLLFHPDLIRGTSLGHAMKDYTFFAYKVHEALHLSQQEKQLVLDCFNKISNELKHAIDKHSRRLIVANIALLLDYCVRFYDRQFITRNQTNTGLLDNFETLLANYLNSDQPQTDGIPSVAFFASRLHLSANYFGDLIKKETGQTAQEYIQLRLIEAAKEKFFDPTKSVSEIAYELGFKYPQHFTRFFKQHVGQTPHEFRNLLP